MICLQIWYDNHSYQIFPEINVHCLAQEPPPRPSAPLPLPVSSPKAAFLPVWVCAKSLQSFLTLCDPMDCSLPGSSVHGILQARILEWVAMSFSRTFYQQWSLFSVLLLWFPSKEDMCFSMNYVVLRVGKNTLIFPHSQVRWDWHFHLNGMKCQTLDCIVTGY